MKLKQITTLYFSPTGGTQRIACLIADELARRLELKTQFVDFTRPEARQKDYRFRSDELVLVAIPVYAGRVPNKLRPDLEARLAGGGTPAMPICVFGNRSPGGAVWELGQLLEHKGFCVVGAAAFVSRHAFSDQVGMGRPDEADRAQMREFAAQMADRLAGPFPTPLDMSGREIGPYYTPLKLDGSPARFLKARPLTAYSLCDKCGLCAEVCPMESIDRETMDAAGLCIKCQACVRHCPAGAKYFEDVDFLSHVAMLEQNYSGRAENMIF